ncbi:uncharacterized protein CLUP02_03128 [Colletotrichum lupini]|uniref:Uncharacterized protein n=1 Tax=Colletotrichum lupini TaxID=145971 RepID=A0A9Q8SHV1_9PEZI|nr:uncharacterized protein CLUP02_03128 [Colletotrichum lupini]UQC77659.1 hypothetical protein CLUP02_03128 [Colletotrichum lupini]
MTLKGNNEPRVTVHHTTCTSCETRFVNPSWYGMVEGPRDTGRHSKHPISFARSLSGTGKELVEAGIHLVISRCHHSFPAGVGLGIQHRNK